MNHIKSQYFLNEACDTQDHANWDLNVCEGEIQLVIYEALEDCFNGEINMVEGFATEMDSLVKLYHWNEDAVYDELHGTDIYYYGGHKKHVYSTCGEDEELSEETDLIYTEEDETLYVNTLIFTETDREKHMYNNDCYAAN
ncbi:MAG: hypothetical protein IJH14_04035 [Solobacterium sp.]|nr:hypothetical protein [Solobacterium sp.]